MSEKIDPESGAWLHVYPQWIWHDEATICGTREGIEALRDALNAALQSSDGVSMAEEVFATDGEGYSVHIHVLPFADMDRLTPYYSDEMINPGPDGFWPHMLPVQPHRERQGEGHGRG